MTESWISLSLFSAVFLGVYDIAKKKSVDGNAVPPVLLVSVSTAALIWCLIALICFFKPDRFPESFQQIGQQSAKEHVALFLKSLLVGSSWALAFFALKYLPISIASPIRATSPFWTILIAVGALGERPTLYCWVGMVVILFGFSLFSFAGAKEGIPFRGNRWVILMVLATLIGAFCGIYDKFLLQGLGLKAPVVQFWFSVYLVPVMVPLTVYWYLKDRSQTPFRFRWSIPLIAVFLLIADYAYFSALADSEAMISVVSTLRRVAVVIPFTYGVLRLKEKEWKTKLSGVVAILAGVTLVNLG